MFIDGGYLVEEIVPEYNENTIISTSRLTKAFGSLVAVNDLHLQVMRGDVFGFLGPNGSGKTTTIRMLLGLIRPTAGRAVIFGMDNAQQLSPILERIGAIVEMPVFYPYLSGSDNLHVIAAASGMLQGSANNQRIAEVLEIVELRRHAKQAYRTYSLGMKQRLGIAAALLADPELVLLDEPTNGLDPQGVFEIRQLIKRLSELGKTIFLSSHILYEVQQVCNRVAILQRGNLVKQGAVSDLLQSDERVELRFNNADETQQALTQLQRYREQGIAWMSEIHTETDKKGQTIISVAAPINRSAEMNALLARNNLFAAELRPHEGSLEEVFLELTSPDASTSSRPGMVALAGKELYPQTQLTTATPETLGTPGMIGTMESTGFHTRTGDGKREMR
ncbi:MAG TPA: ABC transporter ATP-binding protein [Ktedonobacteraceae bacterium]|nr:ABC transporter ATP-binding protein [Ktedonobacteraceae bacterium]